MAALTRVRIDAGATLPVMTVRETDEEMGGSPVLITIRKNAIRMIRQCPGNIFPFND